MTGWIILGIFLILTAGFLLRSRWERKHPVLTSYTVQSGKLPPELHGLRLLFLSDLHDDRYGEGQKVLLDLLDASEPDLILFGGDMMTVKPWNRRDLSPLEEILKHCYSLAPMFYGNGNHEARMAEEKEKYPGKYDAFSELLRKYGVTHLSNNQAEFIHHGEKLSIYGLDLEKKYYDDGRKKPLSSEYLRDRLGEREDSFNVVLCHSPQYLPELSRWGADLVLSGHFHGGTVRLPLLGGVMTPQYQFFSKYTKGQLFEGGTTEIVSGGLGTHSINIRFLNRPEIVAITLERKTDESGSET